MRSTATPTHPRTPVCDPPSPRSVPAFFRYIRPASGYGAHDTPYEEFKAKWHKVSDADIFGTSGGTSSRMKRM